MSERIYRYVAWEDLGPWLRCGWMVTNHYRPFGGNFDAFIIEWPCSCPLGEPPKYEKGLDKGDKALLSLSPNPVE